jgi:hypothetical protein
MKVNMSLISWFSRKKPRPSAATPESSGLGASEVTRPPQEHVSPAARHKLERHERRELLFGVVRDTMIRAGVLAASYKFKVLALDAQGLQYLVVMDLNQQSAKDALRMTEIESVLIDMAKLRHGIMVTAVYWRMNEHIVSTPAAGSPAPAPAPQAAPAYEPLHEDEVAAFKRALASAPVAAPGKTVVSGRRNPAPAAEFEDTHLLPGQARSSPLSVTQYGDLN